MTFKDIHNLNFFKSLLSFSHMCAFYTIFNFSVSWMQNVFISLCICPPNFSEMPLPCPSRFQQTHWILKRTPGRIARLLIATTTPKTYWIFLSAHLSASHNNVTVCTVLSIFIFSIYWTNLNPVPYSMCPAKINFSAFLTVRVVTWTSSGQRK